MASNALYYPYIHIRDVNWLKGTLLLFPQVRRMIPFEGPSPHDAAEIAPFTQWLGRHEPLLAPANLSAPRVRQAQEELATRLERDAQDPEFLRRFDKSATGQTPTADPFGFQIHADKVTPRLKEVLMTRQLAWPPKKLEPQDFDGSYIQVHPRVGEAIMSTLAVNCALAEGLDIVGDERSAGLHRSLIDKDAEAIYDTWLGPESKAVDPAPATAGELFEFIVGFACDLTELTPEAIAAIGEDREGIDTLIGRLRKHAAEIPKMDPGSEREQYFKDTASKALQEWQNQRANMSQFWRTFFGEGLVDTSAKFLETIADKLFVGSIAGGAAAGVAGAATISGLATAGLVGGGAGFVVGLLVHAGKSYTTIKQDERLSHYRYLTAMKQAGVVFRTDFSELKKSPAPSS